MSSPWMPLYVGDYLRDTRRLTTLQHGIYMLLIMDYWSVGSLPDDDSQLAQIAGLTLKQWQCNRNAIASMFQSGWKHKRIDNELAKASDISIKRKANAEKRWSKCNANAYANDMHRAPVSQPQPQSPRSLDLDSTESDRFNGSSNSRRKQVSTGDSAKRFYQAYPKHVEPRSSAKAFDSAVKRVGDPERIIDAAGRFAEACRMAGTEKRYIPAPSVWLNGDRFDDEDLPKPAMKSNSGTMGAINRFLNGDSNERERREEGPCEAVPLLRIERDRG
jgi:uncharacterized protein YdaU (DUF1376 family)